MITFYLQTAVNDYKAEGNLPDWVVYARNFLEHLDEPIETPEQDQKKSEESGSIFNIFDLNEEIKPASMSFLQIKPFQQNGSHYDFRDEHEYKMSKSPDLDLKQKYQDPLLDSDTIAAMNSARELGTKDLTDLSHIENDLFANVKDDKLKEDTEDIKNDSKSYTKKSGAAKIKKTFKEFEETKNKMDD